MSEAAGASEPIYPFVAVDATPEEAEEVGAALFELGAGGVEQRDDVTLARGAGGGKVTLVGSFATREEAEAAVLALREALPDGAARIEEVIGDAWRDAWKEHFEPFALTPRITVAPPWAARPAVAEGVRILELEPGRAFGTGLHATTALVASILDARSDALAGREVLDVGTGSGILALAALILGASFALAVDTDDDVIEVVRENAARNGLGDRLAARAGGAEGVDRVFPWVLANIDARVLRPLAPELARVLAPGGTLVLSGVLEGEHDEIARAYTSLPRGLQHVETRRRGEAAGDAWTALVFTAPLTASAPPRLAPPA